MLNTALQKGRITKAVNKKRDVPFFTMSEMARASSTRTLVPTVDVAKPGPQASLWAPMTTYLSGRVQTQGHGHRGLSQDADRPPPGLLRQTGPPRTWVHEAFDDPEDVVDLPLHQDVVDPQSDHVVLVPQIVDAIPPGRKVLAAQRPEGSRRRVSDCRARCGVERDFDIFREGRKGRGRGGVT